MRATKHARARLQLMRACTCKDLYEKNLVVTSYLMRLSLNFRKDPSFRRGDISLFVTMYNFDIDILSFLKPQKKRHFVRQNLPPRNCQSIYFI